MQKMLHVVMVSLPLPGHINPMLDLSLKLASQGIKITFVNSEFNKSNILKLPPYALPHLDSSHDPFSNITFVYIPDGLPPEHDRKDVIGYLTALDASFGRHFEELLRNQLVLQDPPITCIIGNTFVSHVQEAAEGLGLRYVSFWTQSAASYASVLMTANGYLPPIDSKPSDFLPPRMRIPGVPPLKLGELHGFLKYNSDEIMFRLFVNPFKRIADAEYILMNTFEELEEETVEAVRREHPKVLMVGPLLPGSYFDMEAEIKERPTLCVAEKKYCPLSWLDNQEAGSVIYVSFGSLHLMTAAQMKEIALGLEASKQAFLWVLSKVKEGTLPEGFLERTVERGLVVSWAPQLSVLRHKAVGGFLTHSGWNSTLEGICAGVPLLCAPCHSDQVLNAKCAVDGWHVGLLLERMPPSPPDPGLFERSEVEKKVVQLMQSPHGKSLQAKAREWRARAVKAASHRDGSSFANLQRFIHDLVEKLW